MSLFDKFKLFLFSPINSKSKKIHDQFENNRAKRVELERDLKAALDGENDWFLKGTDPTGIEVELTCKEK